MHIRDYIAIGWLERTTKFYGDAESRMQVWAKCHKLKGAQAAHKLAQLQKFPDSPAWATTTSRFSQRNSTRRMRVSIAAFVSVNSRLRFAAQCCSPPQVATRAVKPLAKLPAPVFMLKTDGLACRSIILLIMPRTPPRPPIVAIFSRVLHLALLRLVQALLHLVSSLFTSYSCSFSVVTTSPSSLCQLDFFSRKLRKNHVCFPYRTDFLPREKKTLDQVYFSPFFTWYRLYSPPASCSFSVVTTPSAAQPTFFLEKKHLISSAQFCTLFDVSSHLAVTPISPRTT